MSTMGRSRLSTSETGAVLTRLSVTVNNQEAEEYRKGHEDGIVWARDYATAQELRDLVENFQPNRVGDSYYDDTHWRGFLAGAEEVLDATQRLQNGRA
jgi:hypothetical protein